MQRNSKTFIYKKNHNYFHNNKKAKRTFIKSSYRHSDLDDKRWSFELVESIGKEATKW